MKKTPVTNQQKLLTLVANETSLLRSTLLKWMLDPRIDMNKECGYPEQITPIDYKMMYEREGIARRVVTCLPEESWAVQPEIYDSEDNDEETEFEQAWKDMNRRLNLIATLQRADEVAGIGRFGIILLGFDDGKDLQEPVEEGGTKKLLYIRTFDESVVQVASSETDKTSPRYGLPNTYSVSFSDETTGITISGVIHWSRVIHILDGKRMSEVYGTPRMQPVYNRLMDIRKVLSGSGEMFWKGAFPGYSFEVNPDLKDATLDAATMRTEFQNYANGLQRYMAMTGVTAKALSPQVSDPNGHINAHMDNIAVSLGIPKRILFGSEQAQLASSQDTRTWNKRMSRRQELFITPFVIRPFIDRLIKFGSLPSPKEMSSEGMAKYDVFWPDMNTLTDQEKADLAAKLTQALAQYASGGVENIIPRKEYFTIFLGKDQEEAEALVQAGDEQSAEENPPEEPHTHETGLEPQNLEDESTADPLDMTTNGGSGSGNFGHSGRPGEVGGSGEGGGSGEHTEEESAAVSSWWQGGYEEINADARSNRITPIMKNLDSAIAKSEPLKEEITVFRGMSLPEGSEIIGNLKKGYSFADNGYVAVTTDAKIAENFAIGGDMDNRAYTLEIKLPAGTKALPIPSGIQERLLPRDTGYFKVDSVKRSGGITKVACRYVNI